MKENPPDPVCPECKNIMKRQLGAAVIWKCEGHSKSKQDSSCATCQKAKIAYNEKALNQHRERQAR